MEKIDCINGGICQYRRCDDIVELVLIFSSFSDDETILAMPLSVPGARTGMPLLVKNELMYVTYSSMFRIKKNALISIIGIIDNHAMNILIQSVSSAMKGNILDTAVPSAIMLFDDKAVCSSINSVDVTEEHPVTSTGKSKYTLADYLYIKDNYQDNIDEILVKYEIKNRQALYRLKYSLSKRFEKTLNNPGPEGLLVEGEQLGEQCNQEGE